jgi:anthranilate phosphoribosyltransferase
MKQLIEEVRAGGELSDARVGEAAAGLLDGSVADGEKADFLEALHRRGETPAEVTAFARAFLERAEAFAVPPGAGPLLDVCGTGGDRLGLFNVSTTVMFVAAGAGARLVKHGNRGITSKSGGADVLEALGVPIEAPAERLQAMLADCGAVFLFAPRFHPAFKAVVAARKMLAARGSASVFNMLGPLLNPARPEFQLAGVFSPKLLALYAEVLPGLGRRRAWIVHGRAGVDGVMDEISTLGPTTIAETGGPVREVDPAGLGVAEASLEQLQGGDAARNAAIVLSILDGAGGPARDIVLVNAAAAIVVCGLAGDWDEGMERARESIDSGRARGVLEAMRRA